MKNPHCHGCVMVKLAIIINPPIFNSLISSCVHQRSQLLRIRSLTCQRACCCHGNSTERYDRRKEMAKRESAARKWVIRVLYARTTSLNLSSTHIKEVPKCVSRLTNLSVLLLNNNSITGLPTELLSLHQVSLLASFVCSQLIYLLENCQGATWNVLHITQICD